MGHNPTLRQKNRLVGIMALFGILIGLVLWSGTGENGRPVLGQKTGGDGRLISIQPLPEADGEMCTFIPASANMSLFAELNQEQESGARGAQGGAEARPSDAVKLAGAKRQPVRMIRDPNPSFSAVAVDLAHDEVVLQDENTWGIMAYNRLDNTPPAARMTEPKRTIRGNDAHLEFNCGLYIDPNNGDIYSTNNDTLGLMTIFSHDAKGDVAPKRVLATSGYGIAVDEERQELFISQQGDGRIVVYEKTAKDKDRPLRFISGNSTKLADPHGMAIDQKRGLIFVANWGTGHKIELPASSKVPWGDVAPSGSDGDGDFARAIPGSGAIEPPSITVYPKDAKGDAAPVRVIQGSKTQMNWPTAVAVDSEHGEIYVANETGHSITVYPIDADGDVAPTRVIKGPKSLIMNPNGLNYDAKHNELWVANFGNHSATVFSRTANGDAAPLRVIRSAPIETPTPMMGNPHTITYDSKREQILVGD